MSIFANWPFARVAAEQKQDHDDSVMVCLRPSPAVIKAFSEMDECTLEPDTLHLTLAYLGSIEDCGGEMGRERLYRACYGTVLATDRPIKGKANGFGWFLNSDSHVLVALWDMPYLGEFRQRLLDQCARHGVPLREEDHGFTPHTTLTHQDETDWTIPKMPTGGSAEVDFGSIWLVWGEDWQEIPLV